MTKHVAQNIIAYACESQSPETFIEEKYLTHISDGKSFWEYLLNASEEYNYSTRNGHLKDRLKNYCATRLQDVANKEELEKQIQQKDIDINELTKANLKLQNEYLPHAIRQASGWKKYFWIGTICTLIGSLGGAWIGLNHSSKVAPAETHYVQGIDTLTSKNKTTSAKQAFLFKIVLAENSIDAFSLPFPEKEMLPILEEFYKPYTVERRIGQQDGPYYEYIQISKGNASILSFDFNPANKYRLEGIYISDTTVIDEYGVKVGDSYSDLIKKRNEKFNNHTNYHQHTYLYANNSNIYYELTGDLKWDGKTDLEKLELTSEQLATWKVEYIIWRKRKKNK